MKRQEREAREPRYRQSPAVERHRFASGAHIERGIMYVFPFEVGNPLSQDQIVPAVRKLVIGESFDFVSEKATQDYWKQIDKRNSPFVPIVVTILDQQGIENGKACAILADDLKRFSPDKSLLSSQNLLKEWLFKLTLGVYAHASIAIKLSQDKDLIDSELGKYYKEVEKQIGIFRQTLSTLGKDDLPYYIRFEDMFLFYGTYDFFGSTLPDMTREAGHTLTSVADNEAIVRESLLEEDRITWERLRSGWGAKEIQDVISLLPNIRSSSVINNVVYALEDTFLGFSEIAPLDRKEKLKIDPLGIIALLKWKSEDVVYGGEYDSFAKMYPGIITKLDENLEFANFSVPRKHLPSTAILLLEEAAKRSDKEEFTNVLKSIHEEAERENLTVPWFVALAYLRSSNVETQQEIEEIVDGSDKLSSPVRNIFLNKQPGKLWLTKDGKLRVTDANTLLLSAFPIYTSSKLPDEIITVQQERPKKEEPKKPEAKVMVVSETSNVPVFGEIGRPEDKDVKDIIAFMFGEQTDLDEEKLLDEFGKLSDGWRMADPDRNRNLLYIARLNASDDKLNQASEHGIEAVYIKGEEAVLIVKKDLAVANAYDKTFPIGLNGKIDGSGQFIIEGMDKSFVGEREHLFLNNLVLHLALQPLLYKSGIPDETDKNTIRATNDAVSSWNRSPLRGLLPKIDRKAEKLNLAIRIAGYSNPVLVGERSR